MQCDCSKEEWLNATGLVSKRITNAMGLFLREWLNAMSVTAIL